MTHSKTQATILGITALAIISAIISLFASNYHHKPDMSVALSGGHIPDSIAYYSDTERYRSADTVVVYRIADSTEIYIIHAGYKHKLFVVEGDTITNY